MCYNLKQQIGSNEGSKNKKARHQNICEAGFIFSFWEKYLTSKLSRKIKRNFSMFKKIFCLGLGLKVETFVLGVCFGNFH